MKQAESFIKQAIRRDLGIIKTRSPKRETAISPLFDMLNDCGLYSVLQGLADLLQQYAQQAGSNHPDSGLLEDFGICRDHIVGAAHSAIPMMARAEQPPNFIKQRLPQTYKTKLDNTVVRRGLAFVIRLIRDYTTDIYAGIDQSGFSHVDRELKAAREAAVVLALKPEATHII